MAMNDRVAKNTLIRVAKEVDAAEKEFLAVGEEEPIDAAFAGKVRELRGLLPKLMGKKAKTLRQLGVEKMIKPNERLESVIDVLLQVARG